MWGSLVLGLNSWSVCFMVFRLVISWVRMVWVCLIWFVILVCFLWRLEMVLGCFVVIFDIYCIGWVDGYIDFGVFVI